MKNCHLHSPHKVIINRPLSHNLERSSVQKAVADDQTERLSRKKPLALLGWHSSITLPFQEFTAIEEKRDITFPEEVVRKKDGSCPIKGGLQVVFRITKKRGETRDDKMMLISYLSSYSTQDA